MAATKDQLNTLHALLAESFATALSTKQVDENGNIVPPSSAMMNVIRQFLKDNNVEALDTPNSPLRKLVSTLPFPSEDSDLH